MNDFIKRCPRCGGSAIGWKQVRIKSNIGKCVFCKECDLKLVSDSVDYLYWRWNRPKEVQAAYLIPLVSKGPDNLAFCSHDLIKLWGGKDRLCKFISVESKREVICVPCLVNPEGVMLKGL